MNHVPNMNRNKFQICRSNGFLQLLFSSFFCRMRFNDSKPFWKNGPKFPWGPKLGAFTVIRTTKKLQLSTNFSHFWVNVDLPSNLLTLGLCHRDPQLLGPAVEQEPEWGAAAARQTWQPGRRTPRSASASRARGAGETTRGATGWRRRRSGRRRQTRRPARTAGRAPGTRPSRPSSRPGRSCCQSSPRRRGAGVGATATHTPTETCWLRRPGGTLFPKTCWQGSANSAFLAQQTEVFPDDQKIYSKKLLSDFDVKL